jgi:hypothetical protein
MEKRVESLLAGKTKLLEENLPQCQSHKLNLGRHVGSLSYGTAMPAFVNTIINLWFS